MLIRIAIILVTIIAFSSNVMARNTKYILPIQEIIESPLGQGKLDKNIQFFFGDENVPKFKKSFGEFTTNRKTNAFFKGDEEACEWAFISALITLQDRAIKEGGNAVVGIYSYYKKKKMSSPDKYECHVGSIIAGVALKGRVVTLK